MVKIRITNPPEGTYWWLAGLLHPFAGSNPLRRHEAWKFPDESWGATELIHPVHGPGVGELYSISAFTQGIPPANPELLARAMLTGTLIKEGKSYIYDFESGAFTEEAGAKLALVLPLALVGVVGVGLVMARKRY